ncbi:MAG: DNA-binding protein [Actinomycetota bacterium]
MDEFVGLSEIAASTSVTKRTALRWVERDDFPPPLGRLATGRIWRGTEVEAWAQENLPLRVGRPAKREEPK